VINNAIYTPILLQHTGVVPNTSLQVMRNQNYCIVAFDIGPIRSYS